MIDLDAFLVALKTALEASPELEAITDRIWLDAVPSGPKPFCRVSMVGGTYRPTMDGGSVDRLPIQFSVFSQSKTEAADLIDAIDNTLETTPPSVTGGFVVGTYLREKIVTADQSIATSVVYHGRLVVEFLVSS